MVQRRAARFVKGRYGMYESVTQMLEELTWVPFRGAKQGALGGSQPPQNFGWGG